MIKLMPYENKSRGVSAYNPFRDMDVFERNFFGSALSEFKTDIRDNGDSFSLEADLPGFKKEDIHVELEGDYMTITAERHSEYENKEKNGNYIRCERSYGSYSRSFNVSEIDAEGIDAVYSDGVLKLTLPKKVQKASSRKVDIK